jgi:hypothetical protein
MYSLWPGLFDLARNPRVSSRPDAATEKAAKALELAREEQERISKEIKRTISDTATTWAKLRNAAKA